MYAMIILTNFSKDFKLAAILIQPLLVIWIITKREKEKLLRQYYQP